MQQSNTVKTQGTVRAEHTCFEQRNCAAGEFCDHRVWSGSLPVGRSHLHIRKEECPSANAHNVCAGPKPIFPGIHSSVLLCSALQEGWALQAGPQAGYGQWGPSQEIGGGKREKPSISAAPYLSLATSEAIAETFPAPPWSPSSFDSSGWSRGNRGLLAVLIYRLCPSLQLGISALPSPWVTNLLHRALCFKYASDYLPWEDWNNIELKAPGQSFRMGPKYTVLLLFRS